MRTEDILIDAFGRIREEVHRVVGDSSEAELTYRPHPDANTISWLVWHLTRVMDNHVCEIADTEQAWTADGWMDRFGLPFDRRTTGYGHTSEDVGRVQPEADLLLGYHDAVQDASVSYLTTIDDDELDRIIDTRWDPPVSVGVRLVSVVGDGMQHVGQAAYIRGLARRS
ncbi:MAG TPA: DUF664 domain-containing protein [Acidimicrobiia bacterium]|nr:DUF664 domain-containing protein [Acidimicrobiia bacterium]